jgi:hypothetical protein
MLGRILWMVDQANIDRVYENRVLRRIFGLKRDKVDGGWRNCIMRSFVIRTLRQV